MTGLALDRRTLLIGGGAGIGLVVAYLAWPKREGSALRPGPADGVFGPYLRIATDGRVTFASPQTEVGQGIWTGLAQIAADELGAAWETMAVEPAPLAAAYANSLIARDYDVETRITACATSIRAFEAPIREAAAVARALLCAAAAQRWNVSAVECDTDGGFVVHEGKRLGFGEVSADAATLSPPDAPPLRAPGTGKLAGDALPRLDLGPKTDGSFRFTADVRLPEMLFASVRLAPPAGKLERFSPEAAKRQAGLVDLVEGDGWLAAIARSWWAADRALTLANPVFSGIRQEPGAVDARLAELLTIGPSTRLFERGDYAAATDGSRPLAATYAIAATPHHSLEPPAAVARFIDDRLEVWTGTQAPDHVRAAAATAANIAERDVTIYAMPVGDGSGRAVEVEAVAIAISLAKRMGRPVSLTFPPATAASHDPVRPPLRAKMSALPTPNGTIAAWRARIVGMPGIEASLARSLGRPTPGFSPRGATPPYAIPAIRIDTITADLPIRAGYMRGGDAAMMAFLTESFIDEMARAMGAEPLAFRIGMLGGAPRLARAISTAAAIGGWDGGAPGSSMGIACASLDGSHIGAVVHASLGPDQRPRVSKITAAVDVGRIVNPGLVRQQVEGGLIAALAAAIIPAPVYVAGVVRATPMRGRGFERLHEVPPVEVELIASNHPPGGVSGLGMAVLAPALANALAASTGKRLRNLPFDPMAAA